MACMEKYKKGEYGYLSYYKKKRAAMAAALVLGMAVIIGFGYWRYRTMRTIFTVAGVLFSLPIAKVLSGLLVVLPIRPLDNVKKEEFAGRLPQLPKGQILWDLALSSPEKVRHFSCVLISDRRVLALFAGGKSKADGDDARVFFRNILKKNCHQAEVFATDQEEEFFSLAASMDFSVARQEEADRVRDTIFVYEM